MRIVVYDPLYSEMGHFYRYNHFLVELLSSINLVSSIIVVAENPKLIELEQISAKVKVVFIDTKLDSIQTKSIKSKGVEKVTFGIQAVKNYLKIIKYINQSKYDFVLFSSQGQVPFWLVVRFLQIPYLVSAISIKWLFDSTFPNRFLRNLYVLFLKSSKLNLFTEEVYKRKALEFNILSSTVMPDRYLVNNINCNTHNKDQKIKLVTVGTISKNKSPLNFLQEWNTIDQKIVFNFQYNIYGKVVDDSLNELEEIIKVTPDVNHENGYVSSGQYNEILKEADFAVIPYSSEYTKYATSGVMWDCFVRKIPILCPNDELFNYYINTFHIGYTYKIGEIDNALSKILRERHSFFDSLNKNYDNLFSINTRKHLTILLSDGLKKISQVKS